MSLILPSKQKGAALITALVLVMLVTLIAAKVQTSFFSSMWSLEMSLQRQQARLILDSTPSLVSSYMEYDDDHQVDSFHDPWLQGSQSFPISDYAVLYAQLLDASARYNINALANAGDRENMTAEQRVFIRLLQTLPTMDVSQEEAISLSIYLGDWLDTDEIITEADSAESSFYQAYGRVPYRAANQPMKSITELKFVKGFSAELFQALRPYIIALPNAELGINVNTASTAILRSINTESDLTPLAEAEVEEWLNYRENTAFTDIQSFTSMPFVMQIQAGGEALEVDSVQFNSSFLLLESDVNFQGRMFYMTSLLSRDAANVTLITKSYGEI